LEAIFPFLLLQSRQKSSSVSLSVFGAIYGQISQDSNMLKLAKNMFLWQEIPGMTIIAISLYIVGLMPKRFGEF
jgi:hypothetical protein